MKTQASILVDFYSALLKQCEIKSEEYAFLKNAVIEHKDCCSRIVIVSEAERVNKFITWAQQFYPDAADRIKVKTNSD